MSIATVAQYERRVRAHHKPERVKIFVSLVWETTCSSWPLIANRSVVSVHASRRGVVAAATARCVGTLPERYRRFSPAASDDFKPWPADRKAAPGHVTTRARQLTSPPEKFVDTRCDARPPDSVTHASAVRSGAPSDESAGTRSVK